MSKTKDAIQTEALNAVESLHKAGVAISVGGGKTLLGLKHMNRNYTDYAKFLVAAPKLSIHREWKLQAEEHKLSHLLPHMDFTTYLSLDKHGMDYDVVYLDECHNLKYSHDAWLNAFPGKILGLTGTPPKFERSEKGKMVSKYCPIVYKYLTDTAIADNMINDYRIIVHRLSLSPLRNLPMHKNGKTWFTSELDSYNYWSNRIDNSHGGKELQIMRVMRMKALQGFKTKEAYATTLLNRSVNKTILFANDQDQADRLCSHSYHSKNPLSQENLDKFEKGEIMKLSCVLQLSEGVNIPNLKEGIIMHSYGNETKSPQRIGRLLRLNPKDVATVHILCYKDTVDEQWVNQVLEGYDARKITWL